MNILVVSVGALGDVLRTTFIAQALRDKYANQNPRITWITDKRALPLFVNNPYVDKVLSVERKDEIKKVEFELVINLEEKKELCEFVSSLNSTKHIGPFLNKKTGRVEYTKESGYWYDMSLISRFDKKKADRLKRQNKKTHREIISEMIGVNGEKYEPFLRLTSKQRSIANDFLRRHHLSRGELIVGINLGAADTWPKALPVKKTAQLIDKIHEKYGGRILLFGGPNEVERNREIQKYTRSPIIDTGCGNDLSEFPALISVCGVMVTTDSLGLHIALALKRRTICLIGPTSPTELDMYGLGKKVAADSKDVGTYKRKTNCMEKIDLKKVMRVLKEVLKQDITLVITAFNESETIGKSIEAALNQETKKQYNIIISAPDEATLRVAREYAKKNKMVSVFKDPGKGKSFALNLLFKKINTDILILTDGDVWMSHESIEEIANLFFDPEIGCVTGRPVPQEGKETKYGFWANFLFDAAHRWRDKAFRESSFIECSGYLFAFRKKKVEEIPLDVAEDTVIPYFFWEKGYKIGYAARAEVYVKNVDNWKDWVKQKARTSKAHETLHKYVDTKTTPRVKTFSNEAKEVFGALQYPKGLKQSLWTMQLIFARLYMWVIVLSDTRLKNKGYQDAWERVESTK